MMTYAEAREAFINLKRTDRRSQYKITIVRGVIKKLDENYPAENLSADYLEYAIKEAVRSYTRYKSTAICVLKEFQKYIEKNCGLKIDVSFPKVDMDNAFERIMYILKSLHDTQKTIDDLLEEIWVSKRTLDGDLASLKGIEPLIILGKPLVVREIERKDGKVAFTSTVHPVFLALDLTQALTMLEGLRKMGRNSMYSQYAIVTAAAIWRQLSEYGRRRLLIVLKDVLNEDTKWYEDLDKMDPAVFMTEYEIGSMDPNNMDIYLMKNNKPIDVEYQSDEGNKHLFDCRVVQGSGNKEVLSVKCRGKVYSIHRDKIIKLTYNLKDLVES